VAGLISVIVVFLVFDDKVNSLLRGEFYFLIVEGRLNIGELFIPQRREFVLLLKCGM
jgi:hypothetical protein